MGVRNFSKESESNNIELPTRPFFAEVVLNLKGLTSIDQLAEKAIKGRMFSQHSVKVNIYVPS